MSSLAVDLLTLPKRFSGKPVSQLEETLALHIRAEKLPPPEREYVFAPDRKWRMDFAWPRLMLAVEVDGEVHRISERFHADIEKHARALLLGWTVLRVGGREVRNGLAIHWLKALIWERT